MLQILSITAPIYILIALGYGARRAGLFSAGDLRVIGRFVVFFALPALLFRALSQRPIGELFDSRFLFAYAAGSAGVIVLGMVVARRRLGRTWPQSALIGLGMGSPNSGFVGYPIALQILGPVAAVAMALCMLVETIVLLPLCLAVAEAGSGDRRPAWIVARETLGRLASNPLIAAIVAAVVVAQSGLPIPEPVARSILLLANASTAAALFVIGGTLEVETARAEIRPVLAVAAGKLLLHPLVVFAIVWVLPPQDLQLRAAAVSFACSPMLSVYPIIAHRFHEERFCSAALVVTTVLSFATISLNLWLLTNVAGWAL